MKLANAYYVSVATFLIAAQAHGDERIFRYREIVSLARGNEASASLGNCATWTVGTNDGSLRSFADANSFRVYTTDEIDASLQGVSHSIESKSDEYQKKVAELTRMIRVLQQTNDALTKRVEQVEAGLDNR